MDITVHVGAEIIVQQHESFIKCTNMLSFSSAAEMLADGSGLLGGTLSREEEDNSTKQRRSLKSSFMSGNKNKR